MTKFLEVQSAYERAKSADDTYWSTLKKIASELRVGFSNYLEAPQSQDVVINGNNAPYVALGVVQQGGKFARGEGIEPLKSGKQLCFAIRFTYNADSKKDAFIIYDLKIAGDYDEFTIWVEGQGSIVIKNNKYSELFDSWLSMALERAGLVISETEII